MLVFLLPYRIYGEKIKLYNILTNRACLTSSGFFTLSATTYTRGNSRKLSKSSWWSCFFTNVPSIFGTHYLSVMFLQILYLVLNANCVACLYPCRRLLFVLDLYLRCHFFHCYLGFLRVQIIQPWNPSWHTKLNCLWCVYVLTYSCVNQINVMIWYNRPYIHVCKQPMTSGCNSLLCAYARRRL